jgi:hypothetical protein
MSAVRLLMRLCELTPARLILGVWFVLFLIAFVQSRFPHPFIAALGLVGALLAMFGYSIIVVLGLPGHAGRVARGTVRGSALAFVVLALLVGLARMGRYDLGQPGVLQAIVTAFVFAPTFIATHVLGNARRAAGFYKPTDFIGTWLALHMFAFGGAWWAHRQVRAVVHDTVASGPSAMIRLK